MKERKWEKMFLCPSDTLGELSPCDGGFSLFSALQISTFSSPACVCFTSPPPLLIHRSHFLSLLSRVRSSSSFSFPLHLTDSRALTQTSVLLMTCSVFLTTPVVTPGLNSSSEPNLCLSLSLSHTHLNKHTHTHCWPHSSWNWRPHAAPCGPSCLPAGCLL